MIVVLLKLQPIYWALYIFSFSGLNVDLTCQEHMSEYFIEIIETAKTAL